MELTGAIQEALLTILCYGDTKREARLVQALVPAASFDPYYRDIAEAAVRYMDQFRKAPDTHTVDLIESIKAKDEGSAEIYDRLFKSIKSTRSNINTEYVMSQAIAFKRYQRARGIVAKTLEILDRDDASCVEEAESVLGSVNKAVEGVNLFDPGILFNDPTQALSFLHDSTLEAYRTGIKELDALNLGPARGISHLFMGLGNTGKSWWGINCGTRAIFDRARVLHVSLEMSKEQVAARYCQSFFSITVNKAEKIVAQRFEKDVDTKQFLGFKPDKITGRPSIRDEGIGTLLRQKITRLLTHKPQLIIKDFPSGQLTMQGLIAYMDNLERVQNFIPDMVIIDYADLMKINDPKHMREETGRLHVDLRGLAKQRSFALVNITQSNRSGYGQKKLKEKHVAEDITKYNTADICFTFNQTEEEEARNLARIIPIKVRQNQKRQVVMISQAYAVGQFCVDSARMKEDKYWDVLGAMED